MEEKERFEYYLAQNQLYDKTNDELYCFGIEQDKTRLVDFLNLMNEDWWTLYIRNKELREENQQLKQQLAENGKEIEKLNACVKFYKSYYISFKDKVIGELEKVKELMRSIDMPNKPELYNNDMFGAGFDSHYIRVKELIDNQIKQLKEMK